MCLFPLEEVTLSRKLSYALCSALTLLAVVGYLNVKMCLFLQLFVSSCKPHQVGTSVFVLEIFKYLRWCKINQ